mmetsp:Transcript_7979/g.49289  ORF Transcript_7979/g.49289 Transcript_7979/m.49289 type:complete len:147 (-) Transcript_7979:1435-1875(-)
MTTMSMPSRNWSVLIVEARGWKGSAGSRTIPSSRSDRRATTTANQESTSDRWSGLPPTYLLTEDGAGEASSKEGNPPSSREALLCLLGWYDEDPFARQAVPESSKSMQWTRQRHGMQKKLLTAVVAKHTNHNSNERQAEDRDQQSG